MQDQSQEETRRILELVEAGTISAEEGEKLIASIDARRYSARCPYCAETIAGGQAVCPECDSPLEPAGALPTPVDAGGFSSLSALPRFLVVYQIVVCVVVLLGGGFISPANVLALVGLVAAIQICRSRPIGWTLACAWAAVQIVDLHLGGFAITRQVLYFGIHFAGNGAGLGLNLVGVVLLVLFLKARPAQAPSSYIQNATTYAGR